MSKTCISDSLILPCGAVLKNRIAKSAMSENLATADYLANKKFNNLYETWSSGGAGLLISGNVMCDKRHLGEPRNIVLETGVKGTDALKEWAQAGIKNQTHLWMQINHPGKQSPKFLNHEPVSASAIPLRAPLNKLFNTPRPLLEKEIYEIIERFTIAAKMAKEAGFTGVQIHGAHGYLVNQFLSPLHNTRTDKWGGSLNNRMRFALEIYQSMRRELGNKFPISIKLNSADFQKGGFTEDESLEVVEILAQAGIDLVEISGGSYEAPEMMGISKTKNQSTIIREAYFLNYCEKLRLKVKVPLMLTGGFRTLEGMDSALKNNSCDVIGLARSLAINPNFPNELLNGQNVQSKVHPISTGIKAIDRAAPLEIIWYSHQLHRMGKGKLPDPNANAIVVILEMILANGLESIKRVRSK
jgi:2,4-dienoyl-CoA reductase-like NADH-dependent reductase (Old Yellow Enzyme family)